MTRIIYTPQKGDPQTTSVNGVEFVANVPVDVQQEWLADKLIGNPWFIKVPDASVVEDEIQKLKEQLAHDEALLPH
jgi:hypothetical protein